MQTEVDHREPSVVVPALHMNEDEESRADATEGMRVNELSAWYGARQAVRNITMSMQGRRVTAIIGPSGCGKSTFIRCLNRMHEVIPGARAQGEVLLRGQNIYDSKVDPVALRRHVGMVFQRPNPFPTMSVLDNVLVGLKLGRRARGTDLRAIAERSLRRAALWDEVKDKLHLSGASLSGGQQQRLCIARALAIDPSSC
jgi:phosphate transport system ATP-binding protein